MLRSLNGDVTSKLFVFLVLNLNLSNSHSKSYRFCVAPYKQDVCLICHIFFTLLVAVSHKFLLLQIFALFRFRQQFHAVNMPQEKSKHTITQSRLAILYSFSFEPIAIPFLRCILFTFCFKVYKLFAIVGIFIQTLQFLFKQNNTNLLDDISNPSHLRSKCDCMYINK